MALVLVLGVLGGVTGAYSQGSDGCFTFPDLIYDSYIGAGGVAFNVGPDLYFLKNGASEPEAVYRTRSSLISESLLLGDSIYMRSSRDNGTITRFQLPSGPVEIVASGLYYPRAFALSESGVPIWMTELDNEFARIETLKDGHIMELARVPLRSGVTHRGLLYDRGAIFWIGEGGSLWRRDPTGKTSQFCAAVSAENPKGCAAFFINMAQDDDFVYFHESTKLRRISKRDSRVTDIWNFYASMPDLHIASINIDSSYVYFAGTRGTGKPENQTGIIGRVNKGGGSPEILNTYSKPNQPRSIGVVGSMLFFTGRNSPENDGWLCRLPIPMLRLSPTTPRKEPQKKKNP